MGDFRKEKDSMGEVRVPEAALYGAQTQRAVNNFPISGLTLPRTMIQALGLIKACAARVNGALNMITPEICEAIIEAAQAVAAGEHDQHFPIDIFQTGSGTSSNMNSNEVIAKLASDKLEKNVHPNDHVNCSQSSNDVIPTCIHVSAALLIKDQLLPALTHLHKVIIDKALSLKDITKTGRTHLMDAMPLRLDQELGAWATQIEQGIKRIEASLPRLYSLAQGGTAVGTGINAHPEFGQRFADELSEATKIDFHPSPDYFMSLSCQDTAVEVSGQLKTLAVSLMKIANDLRWMNSGPLAGLGEIQLESLQPGSSIMPGKVNPVIPESICMLAAQVIGNDTTITIGGQAGNFQLNVMLPVIGYNLCQSIEILANGARCLADQAIVSFTVNEDSLKAQLDRNPILVTALNAVIGYEKGAAIAKIAYQEKRPVKEVAKEMTDLSDEELDELLDPNKLTEGGIQQRSKN